MVIFISFHFFSFLFISIYSHRLYLSYRLCGYNPYCGPHGSCFGADGLLLEDPYWTNISDAGRYYIQLLLLNDKNHLKSFEMKIMG